MSKHDFRYVSKNEAKPIKEELYQILYEVQDLVREHFTFKFYPIGSYSRNMITYDAKSNIGFDFDINIEVNDDDEEYGPDEIRNILRNAIDRVAPRYGYKYCEDSTRVLRIKKVNTVRSRIEHSCDFAIVYNCKDASQQYIRFNKETHTYTWEYQSKGFLSINEKWQWLKNNNYRDELLDYYIYKKNINEDDNKHSRSIFAEAVKELCDKHGYNKSRKKSNK